MIQGIHQVVLEVDQQDRALAFAQLFGHDGMLALDHIEC